MIGRHHRLNGHEFEQTPGDNERQEPGVLQRVGDNCKQLANSIQRCYVWQSEVSLGRRTDLGKQQEIPLNREPTVDHQQAHTGRVGRDIHYFSFSLLPHKKVEGFLLRKIVGMSVQIQVSAKKLSIRKKEFRRRKRRGLQLDRRGSREAAWVGGGKQPWKRDQGGI